MKITEFGIFNLWEEGNQTLSGDLEHFVIIRLINNEQNLFEYFH